MEGFLRVVLIFLVLAVVIAISLVIGLTILGIKSLF